jgi:hypothetical protein
MGGGIFVPLFGLFGPRDVGPDPIPLAYARPSVISLTYSPGE